METFYCIYKTQIHIALKVNFSVCNHSIVHIPLPPPHVADLFFLCNLFFIVSPENVHSSNARGRDGEFLHQLEQAVSDCLSAPRAAAQHHKGKTYCFATL